MGLDITYYSKLTKVDVIVTSSGDMVDRKTGKELDWDDNVFVAYANPDFPGRNGSIEDGAAYSYEDGEGFRAGSYGGYNGWRQELAKIAGWPTAPYEQYGRTTMRHDASAWAAKGGPFWELINFSDCEGIIGPEVSAKLAADFAAYDEAAKASEYPFFYDRYTEWRKAFEVASDGGAVHFH